MKYRIGKDRFVPIIKSETGHSYFRDRDTNQIAIADQSGDYPDETDDGVIVNHWVVKGLTAGTPTTYWLGAKTSGTTKYLAWGGTATGRYCDFIMKVTALPSNLITLG